MNDTHTGGYLNTKLHQPTLYTLDANANFLERKHNLISVFAIEH